MKQAKSEKKETGKVKKEEIPVTVESGQPEVIQNIELSMIVCNPFNPRRYDIQKNVYREHLSSDDSYSWKRLQTKEFRRMLETGYSTDLSRYEFDKSACTGCPFNSSVYDLFADGNCGNC